MKVNQPVTVINKVRRLYVGRGGTIVKEDKRDGQPYFAVKFPGTDHVVWFFAEELAQ